MKKITEWTTIKGDVVKLKDMTTDHIHNCIHCLDIDLLKCGAMVLGYSKDKEVMTMICKRISKIQKNIIAFLTELKRRRNARPKKN